MIIAEYTLDHPALRQTLRRVPGVELTWEDSYTGPDGRMLMIAWIRCEDFDAFDSAIATDPTVDGPRVLAEADSRRLYRVELVGEGATTSIMPVVVAVGGVQQAVVGTSDGWRNRTRFPSRDAFRQVYQFCLDNEISFEFHRIYERSRLFSPDSPALSDLQRATLIEAVDSGYLDIPRKSSLEELGERLGVSRSATSERFRRGVKNLIEETIYPSPEREAR